MFYDATKDREKLTLTRDTFTALVAEYGPNNAVYPLLKWLKEQQDIEPYDVKNNYVFLKLELELAHLIAEREIIAHAVSRTKEDLATSLPYRQIVHRINSFVFAYIGEVTKV